MAATASEYSTLKRPSVGVVALWYTSTCSARRLTAQSIDGCRRRQRRRARRCRITRPIAGWSAPQQAKRLKISPLSTSSSGPSSAVGAVASASPNTARKPCSPSSTASSAMKPRGGELGRLHAVEGRLAGVQRLHHRAEVLADARRRGGGDADGVAHRVGVEAEQARRGGRDAEPVDRAHRVPPAVVVRRVQQRGTAARTPRSPAAYASATSSPLAALALGDREQRRHQARARVRHRRRHVVEVEGVAGGGVRPARRATRAGPAAEPTDARSRRADRPPRRPTRPRSASALPAPGQHAPERVDEGQVDRAVVRRRLRSTGSATSRASISWRRERCIGCHGQSRARAFVE